MSASYERRLIKIPWYDHWQSYSFFATYFFKYCSANINNIIISGIRSLQHASFLSFYWCSFVWCDVFLMVSMKPNSLVCIHSFIYRSEQTRGADSVGFYPDPTFVKMKPKKNWSRSNPEKNRSGSYSILTQ